MLFAETDDAIRRCAAALRVLRPHLSDEDIFARVRKQQATQGYRLAYRESGGIVVSAVGFRPMDTLAWGKMIYIDDLVTLPEARGGGHAGALLDEVITLARLEGCDAVHLDSGYQRQDAHRLYLNRGFVLACHHFALTFPER